MKHLPLSSGERAETSLKLENDFPQEIFSLTSKRHRKGICQRTPHLHSAQMSISAKPKSFLRQYYSWAKKYSCNTSRV